MTVTAAPSVSRDLHALARFSVGGDGVTRPAWSPELFAAYDWLGDRLRALGLDVTVDAAGNLLARWDAADGPALVVGSHLDTVPAGGRYDGALGVVAGMHALRLLRERDFAPACPVWLAAFMDEEGTRFGTSLFGSRAFVGEDVGADLARADADGTTVADAMRSAGFDPARVGAARAVERVGAYLELHIEQGPVLEHSGADVGVVPAICGLTGLRVRFTGQANHAGTTPMDLRRDALVAAAHAVLAVRAIARGRDGIVATVGAIDVQPGAYNVVPGSATIAVDLRGPDAAAIDEAEAELLGVLAGIATDERVDCSIEAGHRLAPTPMDPHLAAQLAAAGRAAGAVTLELDSGAGHDAMVLGRHVPAAMAFVPSTGGLSHNPAEHTDAEHCELAAAVLAGAIERIAGEAA